MRRTILRPRHRRRHGHRDQHGGHEPAGRVLAVGQQPAKLLGLLARDGFENLGHLLDGQLTQKVGRVVEREVSDQVGEDLVGKIIEQVAPRGLRQKSEHQSGVVARQGPQQREPVTLVE